MSKCGLCYRAVTEEQDVAHVIDYANVCNGSATVHLHCFKIRSVASKRLDFFINKTSSDPSPVLDKAVACGYCKGTVGPADDVLVFKQCAHGTVHLQCAFVYDCIRRAGCAFCYKKHHDATSLRAWMNVREVGRSSMIHSLVPLSTIGGDAGSNVFSMTPSTAKSEVVNAMFGNIVLEALNRRVPSVAIAKEYNAKLKHLDEPRYPTVMRQLVFELNFDTQTMARHTHLPSNGRRAVLEMLGPHMTFGDAVEMGLTVYMLLHNRRNLEIFLERILTSSVIRREKLAKWDFSLRALLMAGLALGDIPFSRFGIDDLHLIDFHAPTYYAAGGSYTTLQKSLGHLGRDANIKTLMPQFGMTEDMLNNT